MELTAHLIVSFSVLRWCKCCAFRNNVFFVLLCLLAHPASWCSDDNAYGVLDFELLLSNSPFLPLYLNNYARDFIYITIIIMVCYYITLQNSCSYIYVDFACVKRYLPYIASNIQTAEGSCSWRCKDDTLYAVRKYMNKQYSLYPRLHIPTHNNKY